MSIAAPIAPAAPAAATRPPRRLVVVRDGDAQAQREGGIWCDADFSVEALELAVRLTGLARLEAEILSI